MDTEKEQDSSLVRKALELLGVPKATPLLPMHDPTPKPEGTEAILSDSIPTIEPEKTPPPAVNIPELKPGSTITWFSPLFGRLSGELLAVLDDGKIEVFHPLTDKLVKIPSAWVVCVLSSPPGESEESR